MKVLLVHPNFDTPLGVQIGLSYIAAVLRRADHEVGVVHISEALGYPFDLSRVVNDVREFGAELVAISCGHNHYAEMREVIREVERTLSIPVVLGGVHATLSAEQVLEENPDLSFVCVGEGEEACLDLVTALAEGSETSAIANIWSRSGDAIHRNPVRPFMDLADLPPMANDLWDFQTITDLRRGWVNVSSQRGCPYRCSYCHNNGVTRVLAEHMGRESWGNADLGYLRFRPAQAMVDELRAIADNYRVEAFSFIDDTFTMNRVWLAEFLNLYHEQVDLPYVCNTTAVDLDEETLALMAKTGCRVIRLGVESGSSRLITELLRRKWVGKDRLRWAFRRIQDHGIHALAFNMIGNIGETREETLSTFRFNAELRPTSIRVSIAYPYPGTAYESSARESGLLDDDRSSHNYLDGSIMKQSPDQAVWIDKARTFYSWYVNQFLDNEGSRQFQRMVEALEAIPAENWSDPDTQADLQRQSAELSAELTGSDVFHYTTPFADRPDIVVSSQVVAEQRELIRKEVSEPH